MKKMNKPPSNYLGAMAELFCYMAGVEYMFHGGSSKDPLSGIDIEVEYHKIQEKKSGLSWSMREEVVYRYEQKFKK